MKKTTATAGALLSGVSMIAMGVASQVSAQTAATANAERYAARLEARGAYLSGDKHNHTTCTDGSSSVRTLVDRSTLVYGLDWFAQTGHGGEGSRDCRFDDYDYDGSFGEDGQFWEDTIGAEAIKGDEEFRSGFREMWRWQQLTEYAYPDVANAGRISDQATWLGIETNVPGHEHTSMGILGNQFRTRGDAYATGQFEYLFDRSDDDTSGGEENDFENPANNGVAKVFDNSGLAGHARSVASVAWLRENYPDDSYYAPAHVERQGAFVSFESRGFNPENLRDYHNAGLLDADDVAGTSVGFGAEFIAGHMAQSNRGSYSLSRPTVGLGTYGGGGCYGAAEMFAPAGYVVNPEAPEDSQRSALIAPASFAAMNEGAEDFVLIEEDGIRPPADEVRDGSHLAVLETEIDALFGHNPATPSFDENEPLQQYVFCKPGVKTFWDALLGEGRRYSVVGNSDWHNRGAFGPFDEETTNDFWPGEYQRIWVYTRGGDRGYNFTTARGVVNGLRQGNSWSVMGDLVTEFTHVMCQGSVCATMGETLTVDASSDEPVVWYVRMKDPEGTNSSPYAFDNQMLTPLGLEIPTNEPRLDNIDIIAGDVTGVIEPGTPEYGPGPDTNIKNETTRIIASVFRDGFGAAPEGAVAMSFVEDGEILVASGEIPAAEFDTDKYFRVRGTNMPKGTPNETDADGNPLLDYYTNNTPCAVPYEDPNEETEEQEFNPNTCPVHLPVSERDGLPIVDYDLEAWSDLWLYGNAIFVEVENATVEEAALR